MEKIVKEIVQTLNKKIRKYDIIILGSFVFILFLVIELILFSEHSTSHKIHEISLRFLVLCLILTFSIYIQFIINKRFRISQKLKESEEKFRNIAEQSLFGILIEQDDVIKYANQRMAISMDIV